MSATPLAVQLVIDRLSLLMGVDPLSLDSTRLASVMEQHRARLSLADALAYSAHVQLHPEALDALIDEVVVQETRFFRDPLVFEHVRQAIASQSAGSSAPLRILSAPCGTGQEAWTLAAIVRELGVTDRVTIDAFDLSLSALRAAERGMYPEQSFRHLTAEQTRLLTPDTGAQRSIAPELRRFVRFERRNLAEPDSLMPAGVSDRAPYDLILCRNLFIYLHRAARQSLARSLAAALKPTGRLVLGSADRVEEIAALFSPLSPAASFAFVPIGSTSRPPRPKPPSQQIARAVRTSSNQPALLPEAQTPPKPSTVEDLYLRAMQHHKAGNLRSAERRCRQALYLDPTHLPALELLQTLWRQHPDPRLHHALTDRIRRTRAAASLSTGVNA